VDIDSARLTLGIIATLIAIVGVIKIIRNRELVTPKIYAGLGNSCSRTKIPRFLSTNTHDSPRFIVFRGCPEQFVTHLLEVPLFVENVGLKRSSELLVVIRYPIEHMPEQDDFKLLLDSEESEKEVGYEIGGHTEKTREYVVKMYSIDGVYNGESKLITEYISV